MTLVLVAAAAFAATMLGGLFALRLRDRLHLILGFSAGAVIAVAFFDLLPEALELGDAYGAPAVLGAAALGFFLYLVLDRLLLLHNCAGDEPHARRGAVGAGTLSVHSLLDGVGVGLAFHVSPAIGIVVAAAVLTHDFSDGINTVSLIVKNGGSRARAMRWLALDALAPVAGIALAAFVAVESSVLGLLLGLFGGFFLYIGASDLIPESHHAHPALLTTVMTVLGAVVLYVVVKLAGL